jgi:hypothetical protein
MSALQDLSTSWNWAHVQISGDDSLSDTLATAPGNAISRLLCPRRLDPETSYSAFLVPAFQNGVQAGLGQDVSSFTTSDPAWTENTQGPLTLPFYFRFDFNTSDEGDFESLVRRLTPRVLPASVGQRPMDVSQPDPGIPSAASPLPPGLTLNPATGAITGTPTAAGTYNFRGQVVDSTNTGAGTTTTNCTMNVAPAGITLSPPSTVTAQVGVAYNSALAATGGTPAYTFSLVSGSLPPGLTLNPWSGALSGTPTTAGTFGFSAEVADSTNTTTGTITVDCTIVVAPAGILLSPPAAAAQVGVANNSTLTASSGTPPYTFSIARGSLPPGLTLNSSTGAITGAPTIAGTYNFTAKVADSTNTIAGTATANCTIVVAPSGIQLNAPSASAQVGVAYNSALTATGGTPAYTFSLLGGWLGLEGALESVSTTDTPWTDPDKPAFQGALQNWINQTSPATDDPASPNPKDPVVVPPIYGRWQAAATSVNSAATGWLNDLNLDPRNRSAAGMGTQIVQEEQTQLMASAWQQVEGVLKANQMLKEAQLARSASQQLLRQHFQPAQNETVMNLTAPLHSRLLMSPTTVTSQIRASRVPPRMFSGAFRKVARLPWRLGLAQNGAPTLLTRVNSGEVTIVPPIQPPAGMVSIDQVSNQAAPSWAETLLKWWKWILIGLVILLVAIVLVVGLTVSWLAAIAAGAGIIAVCFAVRTQLKSGIVASTSSLAHAVFKFHDNNHFAGCARAGFPDHCSRTFGDIYLIRQFRLRTSRGLPHCYVAAFRRLSIAAGKSRASAVAQSRHSANEDTETCRSGNDHSQSCSRPASLGSEFPLAARRSARSDHGRADFPAAHVCSAAGSFAKLSFAGRGSDSSRLDWLAAVQSRVHRGLHGRAQQRNGERAFVVWLSHGPTWQLLPPVLGCKRLCPRPGRPNRSEPIGRTVERHSADQYMADRHFTWVASESSRQCARQSGSAGARRTLQALSQRNCLRRQSQDGTK